MLVAVTVTPTSTPPAVSVTVPLNCDRATWADEVALTIKAIRKARVAATPTRYGEPFLISVLLQLVVSGRLVARRAGQPGGRARETTRVMRVVCGRYRTLAGSCQGGSSIQQIGFWWMESTIWMGYGIRTTDLWTTDYGLRATRR